MLEAEYLAGKDLFFIFSSLFMCGIATALGLKANKAKIYIAERKSQLAKKSLEEILTDVRSRSEILNAKIIDGQRTYQKLQDAIFAAQKETAGIKVGLEPPVFCFGDSEKLKSEIISIRAKQFDCIKTNNATRAFSDWSFFGSKSDGSQMVADYRLLLMKAFNSEFEVIRKQMRVNTFDVAVSKLKRLLEQLANLGETANVSISTEYAYLKLDELKIWHNELTEKENIKQQRKLQQAKLREQNKFINENSEELDEEIAQREMELLLAQRKAELLAGEARAALELRINKIIQEKLQLEEKYKRALSQAQITRSGYIYVISNIGCFGEGVVKIGMTRRLEPMDRITELGDASVPFRFDVHTIAFVEDAPKIEKMLHTKFNEFRVNTENFKKEFFRVDPQHVKKAMNDLGIQSEWYFDVDAKEFKESQQIRQVISIGSKNSSRSDELPDSI